MASEEDPTAYEEEEEESEEEDQSLALMNQQEEEDEEEDDVEDEEETSSSNLAGDHPPASAGVVTVAVPGVINGDPPPNLGDSLPDPKRQKIEEALVVQEEKKPPGLDESRRLFQRLWTDEDEIELLQGFLDYTTHRGTHNASHHHDTTAFYDKIKSRLQLDCNKNQLVEKLRRLKKKYRNVVNRISSGKEFAFKSPHDQTTFEISKKIWSGTNGGGVAIGVVEEAGLEDDEPNPISNSTDLNNNGFDINASEKKTPRSRKRPRVKPIEEKSPSNHQLTPPIPNLIEETVKSCLSPLFKELISNAVNGPCGIRGLGMTLNPVPLSFGGTSMNLSSAEMLDEKWRKQQILELEVYSKRLELVQDQIKSTLEELKSRES